MEGRVCVEQESYALKKIHTHEGASEHHQVKGKLARDFEDSQSPWVRKKRITESGLLVFQQQMDPEFYPLSRDECPKKMIDLSMMGIPTATLATEWEEFQAWKADLKLRQRDNKRLAERGVDFSRGEVARSSYRRRSHEERLKMIRSCTGTFDTVELPPRHPDGSSISNSEMFRIIRRANKHQYAQMALEFFEESQGAEFEIVEALYAEASNLVIPGGNSGYSRIAPYNGIQEWLHVSFIAKPKKADCTDVSPKHFFGELLKRDFAGGFDVKYCSTFEPSVDPEFNHGCVLCPANQKFHPGPDGYRSGHLPCYVSEQEVRF